MILKKLLNKWKANICIIRIIMGKTQIKVLGNKYWGDLKI